MEGGLCVSNQASPLTLQGFPLRLRAASRGQRTQPPPSPTPHDVLPKAPGANEGTRRKGWREGAAASGIMLARLPGTDPVCTRTQRCEKKSASTAVCWEENSLSHKSKMNKAAERQTVQSLGRGPRQDGAYHCQPRREKAHGPQGP